MIEGESMFFLETIRMLVALIVLSFACEICGKWGWELSDHVHETWPTIHTILWWDNGLRWDQGWGFVCGYIIISFLNFAQSRCDASSWESWDHSFVSCDRYPQSRALSYFASVYQPKPTESVSCLFIPEQHIADPSLSSSLWGYYA